MAALAERQPHKEDAGESWTLSAAASARFKSSRVINVVINRFPAMRKMPGQHLLCLLLLFITLSWAEDAKKDASKSDNAGSAVFFI